MFCMYVYMYIYVSNRVTGPRCIYIYVYVQLMCVHVPPFVRIMHRAKVFHAKRKGESESFRIENINLSAHNFGMLLQHFVCKLRDRNILS